MLRTSAPLIGALDRISERRTDWKCTTEELPEMPWTEKYWDAVRDFYWVPRYLGLKSIPQKHWVKDETTVTIPRNLTNPSGPLYRRIQSGDEYWSYVRRQEETFNHIWNIALGVLPGDVIADLFNPFLGWQSEDFYSSLSGTTGGRYPVLSDGNVTSPDCLLLSDDSLLAIEIKFNAKTSLAQVAKYLAILVAEEESVKPRSRLGILYVYPVDARLRFAKETGDMANTIDLKAYAELLNATEHPVIKQFMESNRKGFESALERLCISCITWSDITACIAKYTEALGNGKGDRTLGCLLSGLQLEIEKHPLSRVAEVSPS